MKMKVSHVVLIMLSVAVFIGVQAILSIFSKKHGIKAAVFGSR